VEADLRRPEAEAVAEPELFREAPHAVVGREDHVVEAVDRPPVEAERADEPAEAARAFVQRDLYPRLREAVCRGHPENAAADDRDAGAGCVAGEAADARPENRAALGAAGPS